MKADLSSFTDLQLMLLFAHGNEGAFEELYRRTSNALHGYLHRLTGDEQAAEELMQDSFVRVAKAAKDWKPTANFSTWLYRIATNRFLSWRAKRRLVLIPFPTHFQDKTEGPFEQSVTRQAQQDLRQALTNLPGKLATAFTLTQLEDRSYGEAADILEIPEGTVKTHVHRARERLRRILTQHLSTTLPAHQEKEKACH